MTGPDGPTLAKTETPEQKEEQQFYIDTVYKTLKIGKREWKYVDCITTEKRDKLKSFIKIFEKEMREAVASNSDSDAMEAKEKHARSILELCLVNFKWEDAANDDTIGVPLLEFIAKDYKGLFLVVGGSPGSRALSERQLLMQSTLAKLDHSNSSTG